VAFPLHHVIVADDAFMYQAADALQVLRSHAPARRFLGEPRPC
jgi:hypothetical protein